MLVGYPPFFDDNPFGIYEKILAGKIEWTRFIDPIAKDLIKKLLVQDRTKRLGNMKVSRFNFAFVKITYFDEYFSWVFNYKGRGYLKRLHFRSFVIISAIRNLIFLWGEGEGKKSGLELQLIPSIFMKCKKFLKKLENEFYSK